MEFIFSLVSSISSNFQITREFSNNSRHGMKLTALKISKAEVLLEVKEININRNLSKTDTDNGQWYLHRTLGC